MASKDVLKIRKKLGHITDWLTRQIQTTGLDGFVVGVSGGVDSALVSTLCARTGHTVYAVSLPIRSSINLRGQKHLNWLVDNFPNVIVREVDLSLAFEAFSNTLFPQLSGELDLVSANLQSRLRMCALYAFANRFNCLVAGTGNKVEDFGIGFFTKGGDGLVDISPIGDLLKSEVRELAAHLGVLEEIVNAIPTDGLWNDGRSDEDQIGASYDELEWAMDFYEKNTEVHVLELTERQKEVLEIYSDRHKANQHKMKMPPICDMEGL